MIYIKYAFRQKVERRLQYNARLIRLAKAYIDLLHSKTFKQIAKKKTRKCGPSLFYG